MSHRNTVTFAPSDKTRRKINSFVRKNNMNRSWFVSKMMDLALQIEDWQIWIEVEREASPTLSTARKPFND